MCFFIQMSEKLGKSDDLEAPVQKTDREEKNRSNIESASKWNPFPVTTKGPQLLQITITCPELELFSMQTTLVLPVALIEFKMGRGGTHL